MNLGADTGVIAASGTAAPPTPTQPGGDTRWPWEPGTPGPVRVLVPSVVLCAGALLHTPLLVWLRGIWTSQSSEVAAVGLAVVCVVMGLSWLRRSEIVQSLDASRRHDAGAWLVLGSLLTATACIATTNTALLGLTAPTLLHGFAWWCGGKKLAKTILPVYLLVLVVPFESYLPGTELFLQKLGATSAARTLVLLGYDVTRDQTTLFVDGTINHVTSACSGMSTLLAASLGTGVLAHVFRLPMKQTALTLAVAALAVIVLNGVRIAAMSAICVRFGADVAMGPAHEIVGVAVFGAVYLLIYGMVRLQSGKPNVPCQSPRSREAQRDYPRASPSPGATS